MPSKLPTLAVRLEAEWIDRLYAVAARISEATGLPVTQASAVRLAIKALEEKHPEPKGKRREG